MIEQIVTILFWLILLGPIVLFAIRIRRLRHGAEGKLKATVLFFGLAVIPVSIYVLVLFALIGIEELIAKPLISEGMGRTALLIVGLGLAEVILLTAIFAIAASFVRVIKDPTTTS